MPIKRSGLRQLRKDRVRAARNTAMESTLKTIKKQFLTLVSSQKSDEARALLPTLTRTFDRAATKGLIHRNTASRMVSRLSRKVGRAPQSKPARSVSSA